MAMIVGTNHEQELGTKGDKMTCIMHDILSLTI